MLVKLSSKGQVVIPKPIRDALNLRKGALFDVKVEGRRIILEPLTESPIEALYGKYSDVDFLSELEEEHKREVENEKAVRARCLGNPSFPPKRGASCFRS